MHILCVIPVRGGSKGIPRKNLQPIAGKPLLAWTVEQACAAQAQLAPQHELQVIVSTDDDELAKIGRQYGAQLPFMRPADLAQDDTATEPVIEHAIDWAQSQGQTPDDVMLLQATSPVRLPGTLARAVKEFTESGADSMVGVVRIGPFIWAATQPPSAQYRVMARPRRQDLTPETYRYRENGSLYLTKTEIYKKYHNRLGGNIKLFILDEIEGIDIDSPLDFSIAEQQLQKI